MGFCLVLFLMFDGQEGGLVRMAERGCEGGCLKCTDEDT
jgi:hypothetical protein